MLKKIGVGNAEELFKDIPAQYRNPSLDIPHPVSEFELQSEMQGMADQNVLPGDYSCFLGAGSYRHHIPAVVRQIASRSEYMTSYTPYQPEVSQGTLQVHFEFQSLVCQLTGMDVANAGMYDGASSLAEAALMSTRVTKRSRIIIVNTLSPRYIEVVRTFCQAQGVELEIVRDLPKNHDNDIACIIVQQPNYYGYLENIASISEYAHSVGALVTVLVDPVSLGMFKPPGDFNVDIVVAEGQSLGIAPTYGGPYVGFFACKEKYLRQMPGRIVGKTKDTNGHTGYVLTMQTREQHIRRERATSNICTSVGLIALMSTVYMASQGKRGLKHIAELSYHKSHYLASLIDKIPGYSLPLDGVFFREFVVTCPKPASEINKRLLDEKIIGGLDISDQIQNGMLLCCTDVNTRQQIESMANALEKIGAS